MRNREDQQLSLYLPPDDLTNSGCFPREADPPVCSYPASSRPISDAACFVTAVFIFFSCRRLSSIFVSFYVRRAFALTRFVVKTTFYKTFGRPIAKVFLMAILTYQLTYLAWMKLEQDDIKDRTQGELIFLEPDPVVSHLPPSLPTHTVRYLSMHLKKKKKMKRPLTV